MTQGQTLIEGLSEVTVNTSQKNSDVTKNRKPKIIYANEYEVDEHRSYFKK